MSNKKVVVTGGSGFLGSHLADTLTEFGYDVTIFDRKRSEWMNDLQKCVIGDLMDTEALAECFKDAEYVYHMAAIADIGMAAADPTSTVTFNVLGTTNVLQACVDAGVKRFMFGSTVYVYSDQGSFYRVTKQACEGLTEAFQGKYGLEYTVLRYGSLYGPRAQEWNGLRKYITEAVTTGGIKYMGTGEERREYIHVKDAARLSVDALSPEFANQCLTLTGTQVLNSHQLLDTINEVMGGKLKLTFDKKGPYAHHYSLTPYRYTPKQGRKLVPNVFVDIGQGILETVEDVHSRLDHNDE